MAEGVEVLGVNALVRDLRKLDRELARDFQAKLRVLAREVAAVAKAKATGEGFTAPGKSGRGTGALVRDIGISVRGGTAFIREKAVNAQGYPYPAVYEFGHSRWGHRPFLVPAIEESEGHIHQSINQMLDGLVNRFNS